VRHASAAGQTRKVAEAAAASGHGGVPLAAMAAGRDVPASEAGGRRQQHTRLDQLPVADKPQAATVSPGAGDQSIRPRTSTPDQVTVGRGNKTREKDFIHTSWELKE